MRDDNEPAFPWLAPSRDERHHGMSLRDYFAAHALGPVWNNCSVSGVDDIAALTYQMADAMLKARQS